MKNFIFVDFDELVTNSYKGEFTGFNSEKLEALAKVIENEVIVMSKESDVEVVLITEIPEKEVLGKFIEKGYKFANSVEFLRKEDSESTASAIFEFVLNNIRNVSDYVVLGTAASKYVRIPNEKIIIVDENKTINAESVITKLISIRHARKMVVEKIMENIGKLKEEVLNHSKEDEDKSVSPDESKTLSTKTPDEDESKAPSTKTPDASKTKATDKTTTSRAQSTNSNTSKK